MRTILVTGGTGFIGKAVTQALLNQGWAVRMLLRPDAAAGPPRRLPVGVEPCSGDLRDEAAVMRAAVGVDAICHMAADYRLWVPDAASMYAVNVAGTQAVMQAALAAGVGRVVHMSSVATIRTQAGRSADESSRLDEADAIGPYKHSKLVAEQEVLALVRSHGLPAVIVNPSAPVGPGDSRPTPTGRLIQAAVQGRIPAFLDTGLNIVHVEDVAAGCLLALERGCVGERYILGGDDVFLRDILGEIAELTGRPRPRIGLPRPVAMAFAAASESVARLTGREPLATRDGVRMAHHHMFFSSAKAKRDLGYAPRPHGVALADAVDWFLRSRRRGSAPA